MSHATSYYRLLATWLLFSVCLSSVVVGQQPSDDEDPGPLVQDSGVGYIDPAIPANQIRFRYDAAFNNVKPSRAEFFWPLGPPRGPGPGAETSLDYQDASIYLERAFTPGFSVFGELPFRQHNPTLVDNSAGLSDANLGLKLVLQSDCESVTTFQLRTYVPSGDADRGLGNGHVSLEPGLLFYRRLRPRLAFEGEVRDWIPIGGTDGIEGNVLRYGIGATYELTDPCDCRRLAAVIETVGWTVLDGQSAVTTAPPVATQLVSAVGDTIVNAKVGLRWRWNACSDLYVGYGRALTDETWYDDIVRLELRRIY